MAKEKKIPQNPRNAALSSLSRSAKSVEEMKIYLSKKLFSAQEIEETVEWLIECGFLDEAKTCEAFVRSSMEKGRASKRIERDLLNKGISQAIVTEAMEQAFEPHSEREMINDAAKKAFPGDQPLTEKEIARFARKLSAQGFPSSLIWDVVSELKKRSRKEEQEDW